MKKIGRLFFFFLIVIMSGCDIKKADNTIIENPQIWIEDEKTENIQEWKDQEIENSNGNVNVNFEELLRKYYNYLSNKQFSAAAKLTIDKNNTSLEKTYKNIKVALPYNIREYKNISWRYIFNIYYVEEWKNMSTTYEVVKEIKDGKLASISSNEKTWVIPEEFSIIDTSWKYEIFFEWTQKAKDFFPNNDEWIKFLAMESLNLQKENLTEDELNKIKEKISYFKDFFWKYWNSDVVKKYRIRDKTFLNGKEELMMIYNNNEDAMEMGWDWIKIYVIENKWIYSNWDQNFINDFHATSGIPEQIPLRVWEKYFIIENFQYCWASACPFQSDILRELIKSDLFILK